MCSRLEAWKMDTKSDQYGGHYIENCDKGVKVNRGLLL